MSDTEKLLQVGRLAEELSKLKGELNHLEEKSARCQRAYKFAGDAFSHIMVTQQTLVANANMVRQPDNTSLDDLLSAHQLVELLTERDRVRDEVKATSERLRALAPHLL